MDLLLCFAKMGATSLQLQRITYAILYPLDVPSDKIRFYRNFPHAGEEIDPLP
jgi:hypothetical protein